MVLRWCQLERQQVVVFSLIHIWNYGEMLFCLRTPVWIFQWFYKSGGKERTFFVHITRWVSKISLGVKGGGHWHAGMGSSIPYATVHVKASDACCPLEAVPHGGLCPLAVRKLSLSWQLLLFILNGSSAVKKKKAGPQEGWKAREDYVGRAAAGVKWGWAVVWFESKNKNPASGTVAALLLTVPRAYAELPYFPPLHLLVRTKTEKVTGKNQRGWKQKRQQRGLVPL